MAGSGAVGSARKAIPNLVQPKAPQARAKRGGTAEDGRRFVVDYTGRAFSSWQV